MKRSIRRIATAVVWLVVVATMGALAGQASARSVPVKPSTHACAVKVSTAAQAVARWNYLGGGISQALRRAGIDPGDYPRPVQLPVPTAETIC
jgi:hypothetical protein